MDPKKCIGPIPNSRNDHHYIEIGVLLDRIDVAAEQLDVNVWDWGKFLHIILPEHFVGVGPSKPTKALPGTESKIAVMTQRESAGESVTHKEDADWLDEGNERLAPDPSFRNGNFAKGITQRKLVTIDHHSGRIEDAVDPGEEEVGEELAQPRAVPFRCIPTHAIAARELAEGKSIDAAAKAAEVTTEVVRRWLDEDAFTDLVVKLKADPNYQVPRNNGMKGTNQYHFDAARFLANGRTIAETATLVNHKVKTVRGWFSKEWFPALLAEYLPDDVDPHEFLAQLVGEEEQVPTV